MSVFFMIVFFFIAFAIIGLVLLQEGKGGGLTGMSSGMDGVMGARNPLRRMTAYLFAFFVIMCLGINWYFHSTSPNIQSLPQGIELPAAEESMIGDGILRPDASIPWESETEPTVEAPVAETTETPAAAE